MHRLTAWFVGLVLLIGCRTAVSTPGASERLAPDASHERVELLAMGDWGNGRDSQKRVAEALKDYVLSSGLRFNGILLAGDNFYVKLSGVDDPKWQTLFEQMYDPHVLDFPFYVALGNHDYEDGKDEIELAYAQANPQSRWKMPSRWYRIDFPSDDPLLTVFMLDSDKDLMRRQQWQAQNQWLRDELRAGNLGQWVVCCAHHPMFSNGDHGDIGPLQKTWGALFEEYGVDFYVCGHDHDLQHLQMPDWKMSFVLCGGGGAKTRPMRNDRRGPFSRSLYGFAHLTFTLQAATVKLIDVNGQVVHEFERTPDRHVRVLATTGREPAQPRSVKSITRPDAATRPAPSTAPALED